MTGASLATADGVVTIDTSSRLCPDNDRSEAYFEIYRVQEPHVSATRWMGANGAGGCARRAANDCVELRLSDK